MMQSAGPSRTAMAAALYGAAHQGVDGGFLFTDALALQIVGMDGEQVKEG